MIDSAILRRHPSYKTKREDITKNKDITDSHDSLPITAESINAGTWECHECTYVNPSTSTVCSICFNSPVERRHLQTEVLDGHSEKLTNREQTDAPNKEKEDDVNIRDQENNSEKDPIGPSTDSHNQQLDALPDDDDDDNVRIMLNV